MNKKITLNPVKLEIEKLKIEFRDKNNIKSSIIIALNQMKAVHSKMSFGGMSHREIITLELLARCMDKKLEGNGICVSDLTKCLDISMPQVSRMLKGMEEKGYIHRIVNNADRRSTYVTITDIGRLKRRYAMDEMDECINHVIERVGKDRIKEMVEIMNDMVDIMEDEQMRLKQRKDK